MQLKRDLGMTVIFFFNVTDTGNCFFFSLPSTSFMSVPLRLMVGDWTDYQFLRGCIVVTSVVRRYMCWWRISDGGCAY